MGQQLYNDHLGTARFAVTICFCEVLTETSVAGEEALVEVLIVDADGLDEGRVHANHSLPKSRSGNEEKIR